MDKTKENKYPYFPPLVLQAVGVLLERDLLAGSVVDSLNLGGVDTAPQVIEYLDIDDADSFNFKWE